MAVSGSRNWIATRDNIINAALRKLGVKDIFSPATAAEISEASFALNSMVNAWQNDGVKLWTVAEDFIPLTAATLSYALGSTVIGAMDPFFRKDDSDTELNPLTREEYFAISDKKTAGDPIDIYADFQLANPTVYVWPVPSRTTSMVVGTDSLYYLCIKDHTSAAAYRPITGASYATYWLAVSTSTANVWVTATAYYSDVIRYSKVLRLQDFDAAADPDFPVRWTQALIYGLATELAPEYKIPVGERVALASKFASEYGLARRTDYDNTDLRIVPGRK